MKIYLVRHGEAVPPEVNPEKPLSPKGREDIGKIARFLGAKSFPLGAIYHSEKARAKETAEIMKEHIASNVTMEELFQLNPNDPVDPLWRRVLDEGADCMIVGHLPYLNRFLSLALTGKEDFPVVEFGTGTTVCLRSLGQGFSICWALGLEQVENSSS